MTEYYFDPEDEKELKAKFALQRRAEKLPLSVFMASDLPLLLALVDYPYEKKTHVKHSNKEYSKMIREAEKRARRK